MAEWGWIRTWRPLAGLRGREAFLEKAGLRFILFLSGCP